jgi:hypothetical protein
LVVFVVFLSDFCVASFVFSRTVLVVQLGRKQNVAP